MLAEKPGELGMSNLRKRFSYVGVAAVAAQCVFAAPAVAERRSPAPIVFANHAGATAPSVSEMGPIDLRRGAIAAGTEQFPRSNYSASRGTSVPAGTIEPFAGPPYQVEGKWFVPMHEPDYDEVGIASWYGPGFDGELAASGETFDQHALTAAHPTLPIPSVVRVTNLENQRSVLLRLNDRGPYVDDRIIDLSRGAADALDVRRNGTAKVRVEYVGPAPKDPDAMLTERMYASSTPHQRVATPSEQNVWTAELPPAANMPAHPPSQAPAPVEVERPAMSGGFALQVGSFSDLSNAHRQLSELSAHSPGYVTSAVVNGGQFYRVMLGPVADRASGERLMGALQRHGQEAILVSR